MKIVSTLQMKNIEDLAFNLGMTQELLMENAGLALYNLLNKEYELFSKRILILAGSGNNGGDSLVLARKLYSNNINVQVVFTDGVDHYRGASRKNLDLLNKFEIPQTNYFDIANFNIYIKDFDIIIDGIFGIGLNRNIDNQTKDIIDIINKSNIDILSIDIPSGVNGDSGEIMGIAVNANKTLVLGALKIGNLFYPGHLNCGEIFLDKLSISDKISDAVLTSVNLPIKYQNRIEDTYKGDYGKVLFIGGGGQYYGAPYFNSVAFLKSGGGYVNLACPHSLVSTLALKSNEIVFHPLKETREGNISIENLKVILDLTLNMNLVVIGGGFSLEEESQRLTHILVSKINVPLLIDADGLTAISDKLDLLIHRQAPTILTPHLGEMAKLTGKTIEEIKKNTVNIARDFAQKYHIILVLKSARTVIAYPSGKTYVNINGNSCLAVAGSGDILAGIISAQYALGLSFEDAARMGVFIHGLCGDLLASEIGQDGVMAEDILNNLPLTLKNYRKDYEKLKNKIKLI